MKKTKERKKERKNFKWRKRDRGLKEAIKLKKSALKLKPKQKYER
jgi:hypothetical protein